MSPEQCREQILSENYRDFIVLANGARGGFPLEAESLCRQEVGSGYTIAYVKAEEAEPLNFDRFSYYAIPQCYSLLDMEAMNQTGISQVQYYPTLELMGRGIMIGFLDTGIDYQNEVFRKEDGSTRILGIWDQTEQSGSPPEGFSFGSSYSEEQINEALRSETPYEIVPSEDKNGHGTYTASLACGSGNEENRFLGAAPQSAIAMVKLKQAKSYLREFYSISRTAPCYQENDIMLGIRYLTELADRVGMPLVICVALGTNFGGHSGLSPLSVVLQDFAYTVRRVAVVGVGNEANQRHHYYGKFESMEERKEIEIQVGTGVEGFSIELWMELPNLLQISLISPSGEVIPHISVRQGMNVTYQFVFERTEVYVDYRVLIERSSAQMIFLRFRSPAAGIWKIGVEPLRLADGEFHLWLPVRELLTGEVVFLEPNPDTTLTDPSSAEGVITAAYYNGEEMGIDINSGRGYTRTNRIKPDFAVPGTGITGALPGGRFAERSGSSGAAGITAGACAILMEWLSYQPQVEGYDTMQIKGLFILGAVQKPGMTYPNKAWGYGALDVYETLRRIREL